MNNWPLSILFVCGLLEKMKRWINKFYSSFSHAKHSKWWILFGYPWFSVLRRLKPWILGRYPCFTPCITNLLFAFPCQSCSESCAFQAVAAMVDFVYESKPYRKKKRRGKYLVEVLQRALGRWERADGSTGKMASELMRWKGVSFRRVRTPPLDRQQYRGWWILLYWLRWQSQVCHEARW